MSLVRATPALLAILALTLSGPSVLRASEVNESCFDCHSDRDLEREEGGTGSVFVSEAPFAASVHGDLDCTDCHQDVDAEDLPHEAELESVHCVDCHDDVQVDFDKSIHGQALARGAPLAPDCKDCHGVHDILRVDDPNARTYTTRIPYMCGECHREGAPVSRTYEIAEHNIIENFSQSIHGEGLFKKGLIVTATCTSCHSAHEILPHTDPRASISPRNIAQTCMQCHSQIETVHAKVIRGELWESAPGAIPACTSCHLPHKVRKETVALTISDRDCLECHEKPDLFRVAEADTIPLTVHRGTLEASVHQNITCVTCHNDVDPRLDRPCEPSGRIDCSTCHAKISEEYFISGHGTGFLNGAAGAPYCTDCHGTHAVKSHRDEMAETYRASVPALCGECHIEDGRAQSAAGLSETDAFTDYSSSVHGRGLTEKGLLPSAICIDCHGSHQVLPHSDERSSVHPANIAGTCATCHRGIYKEFAKSIHFQRATDEGAEHELPTCSSCHSSHTIGETEKDGFLTEVTHQCGSCHEHLAETYLDTMHGKAYQLGYLDAAKCSDCHGAHAIFAGNDPQSSVAFRNIVDTCKKCHEDANVRFTGYLTHATHHDPDKYPALYYTYWAMTSLLVGVFGFFGVHTLLWLPRAVSSYRERKAHEKAHETRHYIRRFTGVQMFTHVLVVVSFLSLALTGMMLKFSTMAWAANLSEMLGGVRAAGMIHRTAAVVTFSYFIIHLVTLFRFKRQWRLSLTKLIFDKESLMFNKQDLLDFVATIKWFVGKGPKPEYGRWTYWEKFDYMAVFWGVAVIGLSGLMLWFPEFFTRFVPGWLINIATIIHSDEALLAVGFIFTIHFFNTHLRPDAFPMDMVVFTGLVPLEEYRRERPREYAHLKETGRLRKRMTTVGPTPRRLLIARIFGSAALITGLVLIGLIIYSVLFGYT